MRTLSRRPESPALPRRALARCAADVDELARAWGVRPVLSEAASFGTKAKRFVDLFHLDAVDELLSQRGLRTPFLRLAHDGEVVATARFTRPGGAGAEIADQVDEAAVARLFAEGATIVLQALHRTWGPLIEFAIDLRAELGHPVQINAYVTPPASRGFGAHYDVHDVFVLQFAGEKRWLVNEPVLEAPLRTQPWTQRRQLVQQAATAEPLLDITLRPGDALYLPRGFIHAAEALGDVSGHLTVGIHTVTRRALLDALLAVTDENVELRRSLPFGVDLTDPIALGVELEATLAALTDSLAAATPELAAHRLPGDVLGTARAAPLRPLAQAAAVVGLDEHTLLRARDGLTILGIEPRADVTVLHLADRDIELPELDPACLSELLDGEVHSPGELMEDQSRSLQAVRTLLLEGAVVAVQR